MDHQTPAFILLLSVQLLICHGCLVAAAARSPKAVILPVTKDIASSQYVTTIQQQTPLQTEKLVVDVGGLFLWVDCDSGYNSTTARDVPCHSAACSSTKSRACGVCLYPPRSPLSCGPNACSALVQSPLRMPYNSNFTYSSFAQDVVSLRSTDGKTVGPLATIPNFTFACGATHVLGGLAAGSRGVVGLGRSAVGLPNQLAAALGLGRKFALCLPSSSSPGFVLFGDVPYWLQPGIDVSKSLVYTQLLINPFTETNSYFSGPGSKQYFIQVTAIKVNERKVPVNATLLKISPKEQAGVGGTQLSTVLPYTLMARPIYTAVEAAFVAAAAAMNITRVAAIDPFGACFSTKNVFSIRVGMVVPVISFVLDKPSTEWKFWGKNSMVEVSGDVMCLGFIDGDRFLTAASIVIGGRQLEDNLLQFDLAANRLGFSSTLLSQQTTCSSFDFGSSP